MFCKECGKKVRKNAVACTSCGVNPKSSKNFCGECGVKTKSNQIVCIKCGVSLENQRHMSAMGYYYSKAFELGKKEYGRILGNIFFLAFVSLLCTLTVIGIFLIPALYIGYYKFLLKIARGENVAVGQDFEEGFKEKGLWWKALLLMTLVFLGQIIGFLFLLVPGIYLMIVWCIAFTLFVDKKMSPLDALGESRRLIHKLGFWNVAFTFFLMNLVVNLVALIPFVGNIFILIVYPFVSMVPIVIYQDAVGENTT
tara:strand:- start:365 stop:1126 length:762 start_codon:yes stop_codon:yes gene_type:complete